MAIARRHNLIEIEDCACVIETEFHGQNAGTFGDFGCYSFYVTKNVVTGDGGMILGRSEAHVACARMVALHGMSKAACHLFGDQGYKHYQAVECGFKYNMMDLQAAIGLHPLVRVEENWQRRHELWQRYDNAFTDLPITLPAAPEADTRHGYHLYTVMIDPARCGISRDAFLDAMNAVRIGTGVHCLSVPEHPYYQQHFGWQPEQWPHAMRLGRQTVSLPLSPAMSDPDADRVIQAVREILRGANVSLLLGASAHHFSPSSQ